jgi:hypothetical protein
MPPIEKPSTSALFKPSARLKATALAPICSNVVGTSPELLENDFRHSPNCIWRLAA